MRVLALSSWWPEPADNGSRIRIARLLETLGRAHEVHLLALSADPVPPEGPPALPGRPEQQHLKSSCASARAIRYTRRPAGYADRIASIGRPLPASVRASYTPQRTAACSSLAPRRAAAVQ